MKISISSVVFYKKIILVLVFALFSLTVNSQTVKTTTGAGSWDIAGNWSPSGVPTGSNTIVIGHAMTRSSNLTLSAWSSSPTITINSGGSLSVTGNLTLEGGSMRFTVNGGSLSVSGVLKTQNNGAMLTVSSGSLSAGTLTVGSNSTITISSGVTANANALITENSGTALFQNNGVTNISGNISQSGPINNTGTLTFVSITAANTGGALFSNYGTVDMSGSATFPGAAKFRVYPGGVTIIDGSFTSNGNANLVVGTSAAPPAYADVIIKGNLNSTGSGDILVDRNGRLAVYGDVTADANGGSIFTINNGGQVYVGGDLNYPGGGDAITNNNTSNIGLYIDGVVNVASGNIGSEESTGGYATSDYLKSEPGGEDFLSWVTSIEESPLPVVLLNFGVKESDVGVMVFWETVSEINNDFFTIEKSMDGLSFIELTKIDGRGSTSDKQSYSWVDAQVANGLVYYRLLQTDFDGATELIGLKSLNSSGFKTAFSFYPNPVSKSELLRFDGVIPETILLYDQSGQLILESQVLSNLIQLPSDIKSGIYLMVTSVGGQRASYRLFVN